MTYILELVTEAREIVRNCWAAMRTGEVAWADGLEVIENTLNDTARKVEL